MEQALDLTPDADTLKLRCKLSKNHEKTLVLMMHQISECGRFVQSYAKDVNFCMSFISFKVDNGLIRSLGKRFIKNMASNEKKIVVNFQETLMKLRHNFLSEVIVTVEINVFRILAELESITEVIKGLGVWCFIVVMLQLYTTLIDLDLKLQELPYG